MNLRSLFDTGKICFDNEGTDGEGWTLSATGDYAIFPATGKLIKENGGGELAENIRHLTTSDVSITNLEIGLADSDNLDGPGVRGDRDVFMGFHRKAPFTIYNLANNHIRDAGAEELRKTLKRFDSEKILYVGAGNDQAGAEAPLFYMVKGIKIGILAFSQNENQIADPVTPGTAELLPDKVLNAAKILVGQCDVPIVIMHEGFEFMNFPRPAFRKLCRDLAHVGVKLVIGHHSHVPQGIEKVDGSVIFYSLGDFFFDQPHFKPYPWTLRSFVPVISFQGKNISGIELRPLTIEASPLLVRSATPDESVFLLDHLKSCSEILHDDSRLQHAMDEFFTNILMPEFFGFLQNYGNRHDGDFSGLIDKFKNQITVHKLFEDFVSTYSK